MATPPLSMTYWNAATYDPPSQPLLYLLQDTSCCSERLGRHCVTIWCIPSMAPVAENAQQLPIKTSWSLFYASWINELLKQKENIFVGTYILLFNFQFDTYIICSFFLINALILIYLHYCFYTKANRLN